MTSVLAHDQGYAIATCGNVFISVWKEPSTLDRLDHVRACEQKLVDQSPGGIVVLTVLMDTSFKVDSNVRDKAAGIARQFAAVTRAHAYVIEGSGFRTAAMRAVIAGINTFVRTGHPVKVFSDQASAVGWLATQSGQALDVAQLDEAIAGARSALRPS
jgi:hypothetical protein